ncbi:carbohydrate kinase [Eubacteriales bacterium OttesenSCG-928-A19]|nr:carbohydrate kinase [Eubacteriales bacterium OttesenSCG-928-A19]
MARVLALGEVLIDFTPSGASDRGRTLYECNPGGAPANMLGCLTQFGHTCELIACVGDDAFGREIEGALARAGIGLDYLKRTSDAPTTLAVVSLTPDGDRSFTFYRDHCADILVSPEDITSAMLEGAALVHVGSLSLTHEPARTATMRLLALARVAGVPVSYDPNLRPPLWKDMTAAREALCSVLPHVDILKLSEEEALFLAGEETGDGGADGAARHLLDAHPNLRAAFVTMGPEGSAYYLPSGESGHVPACRGERVVDTTGAGDYFFAGALSRVLEAGINVLDADIAREACERGNRCGYRVALVRGALGVRVMESADGRGSGGTLLSF